ncbi:MAG TPA: carboxypeptidase regulatory-like domain-containing protein [Gemmatimonadales bacterium]|nr:carboxypeptidase regulatory-like domain-containing protein [Gemmatimonadales bacterium]
MMRARLVRWRTAGSLLLFAGLPAVVAAQGVTTAAIDGFITQETGEPITEANIVAVHLPSGTEYRAVARTGGAYTIANMRVGGPYRVTASYIGFEPKTQDNVFLSLGQTNRVDLSLKPQAVQLQEIAVTGEEDKVLNPDRTGAATFISPQQVEILPSIKRSTRDLTRLDPRSDGNFAFAGRNWLYNNVSLDGSYFNNSFGLDDPAPGGQANAEPVPYDAIEQVQVSVAPFDVREGGFTGANINTVTKSGTNDWHASIYSFGRTENLEGNTVRGQEVTANPDLKYIQSGISFSGPIIRDKLFFFVNGEIERNDDPGSNFVASSNGVEGFGISRVRADTMELIRKRMIDVYGYDPGVFQNYTSQTDNNKILAKVDWNINPSNNLTFRWNYLDAKRDLGPHPFVLSFNNTGRGPNSSSLPFRNAGYAINNDLNSFALELNSRSTGFANRFFASYNRSRDFRQPFTPVPYPTIEIGEKGVTYTTLGEEPFSNHNILNSDVWQVTNNFTLFRGRHSLTFGGNFESFGFFNSFNIFRNGFFPAASSFTSLEDFFQRTTPGDSNFVNFDGLVSNGLYKGENINVGQVGFYAQDELLASDRLNLTFGMRVDFPMYFTDPVDNAYSRGLTALDENRNPEVVDQSRLPGTKPLFSPRFGFNWNASGDRRTQIRGGTGVFTGRVPFVWIGNVVSNPGANPKLPSDFTGAPDTTFTGDSTILKQSFDLNAMVPNFKWPQVWMTDLAIDQQLGRGFLGTLEVMYGNDLHNVFVRNADLAPQVRTLPDGRPYYGGAGANELNPDGAGIYVLDNTSKGHNLNVTTQLRKTWAFGLSATAAYSYTDAKNALKSTEIASVLWQNQPVQGDPNNPELSFSEFGQRHRIVGGATYVKPWSPSLRTSIGMFLEVAEGGRFAGAGGNRYSFIYSGDVNGDGQGGNDLIYIPRDQSEIVFGPCEKACGSNVTPDQQWAAFDAFIKQDKYLNAHRGEIAERFGEVNPWYSNIDLRILQDFGFGGAQRHNFQVSVDLLNVANLINSDWGVRKIASSTATSPLQLTTDANGVPQFDANGAPILNFTGPARTFIDDPSVYSRWRMQLGLRYFLQ